MLDSHDARDKLTYAAYKRCKQSQKVIARKPGGSANSGYKRAEARDYNTEQYDHRRAYYHQYSGDLEKFASLHSVFSFSIF